MKMKMILLVLGLAMVKDQTLAASKQYLVESKGKHYLVETKGKTQVGKGGGGERPLGEKLLDGFEFKDDEGETYNLTGAIELHRLILEDYDQLKKRNDEITKTIIDSTCAIDDEHDGHYKEVTPLFLACWFGADKASKAATLLLSKGADPNKAVKYRNEDGYEDATTPLYQAASDGSIELVKSLLASGADPNKGQRSTDEDGDVTVETPLHDAALYGHTEIVRSLLERGADPNEGARSADKDGDVEVETPLYWAADGGYTEIVRILLASGARQDLDTGMSPLEVAKDSNEDDDSYEDEDDREAAQLKKREIVKLLEAAQSG